MDLLKGVEQIAGDGIAEAVFEDHQPSAVLRGCPHTGNLRITAHKRAVSPAAAIFVTVEEHTLIGLSHTDHAVFIIDGVIDVGRGVGHITGHVVDEILRGILDGDVLRVAIHAAHIAVYHLTVVAREVAEGHTCHLCKFLCGIVGAQRCPVVVCTQEDILIGMFPQRGIDIHGFHVGRQMADHVVDGRALGIGTLAHFLGTVVFHRRGDDHTVDVHVGEGVLVFVGSHGIACASSAGAAKGHQGAHLLAAAHDDDAGIGYLGILVGCHVVLVVVGGVCLLGLFCDGRDFLVFRLTDGTIGTGVEGDVLLARLQSDQILDMHAETHEMVAEGFAVAEP